MKIAAGLNAEGIPSPSVGTERKSSGHCKQNTINGNAARGMGILHNELYIGRLVWNLLTYAKNLDMERRVSRVIGCCRMIMRLTRRSDRTTPCCASG